MSNDSVTVLLVEDNPHDRELILRVFRRRQFADTVDVAVDGADALDLLFGRGAHEARGAAPTPCVIFLDLKLPKIGGIEVLRTIRADERTRHVPVVILTSSEEQRDLLATYELGANSFIVKPIDFTSFSRTIEEVGLYWTSYNRTPA
jgi:two-component system response regulator